MFEILTDPTTIITVLIALFARRLGELGDQLIQRARSTSGWLKKRARILRFGYLRKLSKRYRNEANVYREIVRNYMLMLFFVGGFLGLSILSKIDPAFSIFQADRALEHLLFSPVYCIEVLWLFQRERMNLLIKLRERLH